MDSDQNFGNVKRHQVSGSSHPGKPQLRLENIILIPSQPLLCPGCWNCLGGSDDLIRGRQLSQTSVIAGSIERNLGSLGVDIFGKACFSPIPRVYV